MLTPKDELTKRIQNIKNRIYQDFPQLSGIFIFSRLNIYYFTGTLANGVLYIPLDGKPVLFVRKGLERAKTECPFNHIYSYKSYSELTKILMDIDPLQENKQYGIESTGLNYQLADLFFNKITALSPANTLAADECIRKVRSVKSPYECEKMREAGKRHALALEKILSHELDKIINKGYFRKSFLNDFANEIAQLDLPNKKALTERNISELCIDIFTELGHCHMGRMSAHGEEVFYGHTACGNNLNKAHYYNGAMGFDGLHPALPCLGSDKIWQKGEILCADMLFNYQGYHTDKTQSYFYGKEQDLPDTAKKALECCLEIQELIQTKLKTGTIPEELWLETLNIVKHFDFMDNFMGYKDNGVPFLGHGIGLTVDEYPVIAKNFRTPLENSMFIACEPKIAIPGWGMVSIENTFELIDNNVKNITSENDGSIIFIN